MIRKLTHIAEDLEAAAQQIRQLLASIEADRRATEETRERRRAAAAGAREKLARKLAQRQKRLKTSP